MSRCDFKIVFLGSEYVGKTSLVLRFANCTFNAALPGTTIGAAFCSKQIVCNGRDYSLGIWDTAGCERYEALTRIYYRGAQAAVLCYQPHVLESWSRLRHWLTELRSVEEDCKVYLCATKKDLLDSGAVERQVPSDMVATYALGLNGHFETSSKTGEGIDELFQKIIKDCTSDADLMRKTEDKRRKLIEEEKLLKKKACYC